MTLCIIMLQEKKQHTTQGHHLKTIPAHKWMMTSSLWINNFPHFKQLSHNWIQTNTTSKQKKNTEQWQNNKLDSWQIRDSVILSSTGYSRDQVFLYKNHHKTIFSSSILSTPSFFIIFSTNPKNPCKLPNSFLDHTFQTLWLCGIYALFGWWEFYKYNPVPPQTQLQNWTNIQTSDKAIS